MEGIYPLTVTLTKKEAIMRKVKLIIHETYQGKRKSEDVNAAVFLSDIIALLDRWGKCVVEYTYDAWGKVLSVTGSMAGSVGKDNPLRYRGYYYDQETGLYYLQSRYYDPETGRFISADGVNMLLSGEQAYTYCGNNPVNRSDPMGTFNSGSYISCDGWIDTALHMGLSPFETTYYDLAYAMSIGIGGEIYSENTKALFAENNMRMISDIGFNWKMMTAIPTVFRPLRPAISYYSATYLTGVLNYFHNLSYQFSNSNIGWGELIYNQNDPSMKYFRYGFVNQTTGGFVNQTLGIEEIKDATSVICEVVALYNALTLMGRKVLFSELLFKCEMSNHMMLGGFFGTSPTVVKFFAKEYGLTYDYTDDLNTLDTWQPSRGVVFLSFLNDKDDITEGIHTVAAQIELYNKPFGNSNIADKHIVVYNASSKCEYHDSFSAFIQEHNRDFLCAYYLYDFLG